MKFTVKTQEAPPKVMDWNNDGVFASDMVVVGWWLIMLNEKAKRKESGRDTLGVLM